MKQPERVIANRVIQILTIYMLIHYVYLTYEEHTLNLFWSIVAFMLGVLGYFRQLPTAILVTLIVIVFYGSVVMYQIWGSQSLPSVTWNEIFWLCMFPFTAMIGGIHREDRLPKLKNKSLVHVKRMLHEEHMQIDQRVMPDERLHFIPSHISHFLSILEEHIRECQQNQATFTLLLSQISAFRLFEKEYGEEQAEHLLNRTGAMINEVLPDVQLKAYLGDGLFAVILPGSSKVSTDMIQIRLDNRFRTMMLARYRSDGVIHVSLIYGSADFPIDGTDAEILLNQSLQELEFAQKDVVI